MALAKLEEVGKEIDRVIESCLPFANNELKTFSASLTLAEGVGTLREIFLKHPGIKKTIQSMQDTKLGFLTDRNPKALAYARAQGKKTEPYSYEEVVECAIEGLLKGYRLTNNEFNIISGGFYEAKNGKYRKIIEHPEVTNFQFTNTSPLYVSEKLAKVQVFASWVQGGQIRTLGTSDKEKGKEDTLIFTIKVNSGMGDDAVVGKALSKLFTRVLMRITGRVISEATEVEFTDTTVPGDGVRVLPESTMPVAEPGKVVYSIQQAHNGDQDSTVLSQELTQTPTAEVGSNLSSDLVPPTEGGEKGEGSKTEVETDQPDETTMMFVAQANDFKAAIDQADWDKIINHCKLVGKSLEDLPVDRRNFFLKQCELRYLAKKKREGAGK
jgi:hypothetical protein